jgi:Holliday junction resolvase RusA-like endonuclease
MPSNAPPIIITFRQPSPLMSMNDRTHWTAHARSVKRWRSAARLAGATGDTPSRPLTPSTVTITLPVTDRRRRDPHNYFATVKPIIDGLVDAGLWPDDTPAWVTTTEPALRITSDQTVTVTITPRHTP